MNPMLNGVRVEIRSVNARKEKHGEDLVLATDVGIAILHKTDGKAWEDLAAWLTAMPGVANASAPEVLASDALEAIGAIAETIKFSAALENYRVAIRQGSRTLALFGHAKINKFEFDPDKGLIKFRVQSHTAHDAIGKLAGALMDVVSIDCELAQTELELTNEPMNESTGDSEQQELAPGSPFGPITLQNLQNLGVVILSSSEVDPDLWYIEKKGKPRQMNTAELMALSKQGHRVNH